MFLAPNLNNTNTVHPCIVATSGISNESMNALAHSTSHIGLVSCHRDSSVCMLQANEAVLSRNPSELTDLNLGTSYFSAPHLRLPIRLRHSAISAANQILYQMITRGGAGGAAHLSSPPSYSAASNWLSYGPSNPIDINLNWFTHYALV